MSDNQGVITYTGRALRSIGSIVANITEEEKHVDELHITEHPVEQGANITDHAFMTPPEVTIRCAWSNSGGGGIADGSAVNNGLGRGTSLVQDVYQSLLDLQRSAKPITIYTGKRKYDNMLIKTITVETDRRTENALSALLTCRQIIIVQTTTVELPANAAAHLNPADTAAPADLGTKQLTERAVTVDEADLIESLSADQLKALGLTRTGG